MPHARLGVQCHWRLGVLAMHPPIMLVSTSWNHGGPGGRGWTGAQNLAAEATNLTVTMLPTCPVSTRGRGGTPSRRVWNFGINPCRCSGLRLSPGRVLSLSLCACSVSVPIPLSCSPPRRRVGHLHTGTQSLIHTLMTTNTSTTSSSTDRKPCGTRPHFTTHRRACGH
jgi:hypothetical protein